MDVYIGFGLLSAGTVVLIFMLFDGWLKKRDAKIVQMAQIARMPDKTLEEPELLFSDNVAVEPLEPWNDILDSIDHSVNRSWEREDDKQTVGAESLIEDNSDPSIPEDDFSSAPVSSPEKNQQLTQLRQERNVFTPPNLLVLSVMAKKDNLFESYDLLQAISATGMQFGEMNIFHYYQSTAVGKVALFSLASANKPGEFDLNNIGDFACNGLMLFLDMAQVPDPQYAFKLMLETAERLAEDLDGSLRADPMTLWNEKIAWQYHQKIMQYKTSTNKINA